ncbi:MAG: hypothetical protein PHW04_18375 [Candidatus Wallbacteria bacterium]|nr:hypothetical protein [Candidatus Wallbacteria bacterium]
MSKMLTAMILVLAINGVHAENPNLEISLFTLARDYYAGMEKIYQKADQESVTVKDVDSVIEPVRAEAALISGAVIEKMKNSDRSDYNDLVKLYNLHVNAAPELREPFNLVVDEIVEYQKSQELSREYFPGYGYSEDGVFGYKYRKTIELSREMQSVYWKKIEKTIEEGKRIKLVLEVEQAVVFDPSALLKAVGIPFEIKLDSKTKMVCEYEVTFKKTTKTTCNQKFQKVKVWFQLQRAKKVGPVSGTWSDCGKTYDMKEEESSLPVTENVAQGA